VKHNSPKKKEKPNDRAVAQPLLKARLQILITSASLVVMPTGRKDLMTIAKGVKMRVAYYDGWLFQANTKLRGGKLSAIVNWRSLLLCRTAHWSLVINQTKPVQTPLAPLPPH
jgi:hypothetical protein